MQIDPIEKYVILDHIAEGSQGQVFKAIMKNKGQRVAIKRMKFKNLHYIEQNTLREIMALHQLKSQPNIVELIEVIYSGDSISLVFPLYECTLFQFIQTPLIDYKSIFKQLLNGVLQIHNSGIIHRDLKPLNILLDENQNVKIGDFGQARWSQYTCLILSSDIERYTNDICTLHYRSPEILLGSEDYSQALDMWSLGCIFVQIITKQVLFLGHTQIEMLFKIFQILGTPSQLIAPNLCKLKAWHKTVYPMFFPSNFFYTQQFKCIGDKGSNLISQMLKLDPQQRISAKDALQHAYFQ
ncbi:hypothetical protein pb186bvf_011439 [Paramecium bursaria]